VNDLPVEYQKWRDRRNGPWSAESLAQEAWRAGYAVGLERGAQEAEGHKETIYGPHGTEWVVSEVGKEIAEDIRALK
jgi:hypothetical protein